MEDAAKIYDLILVIHEGTGFLEKDYLLGR
jgi:hypothetical protein